MIKKIFFLLCLLTTFSLAQETFGPASTDYRMELWYNYSILPFYDGSTRPAISNIDIGSEYHYKINRIAYQWDMDYHDIPRNSTIDKVEITYKYSYEDASDNLPLWIYELDKNISDASPDIDDLYLGMNYQATYGRKITASHELPGSVVTYQSTQFDIDEWQTAIDNALEKGNLVLGFRSGAENVENPPNRNYRVRSDEVTLKIEFTPRTRDVTLNQKLSTGSSVGVLKHWEGSSWSSNISPGTDVTLVEGGYEVLLGDQSIYSSQKYNNWDGNLDDIQNFKPMEVLENTDEFQSNFLPINSGITVKTSLEGMSGTGGNIEFFDPWLIDYTDADYANQKRNRGMSAVFREQSSPFIPNYSSYYNGYQYQGLFTNQNYATQEAYYKVRVDQTQTISIDGYNHTINFLEWGGTNVAYQNSSALETGVIFQSSNASAEAIYKGTELSSLSTAYSNNGQRKLIETESGNQTWLHKVYSSMGHVWIEHSSNNGQTWVLGNNGQPLDGSAGGKNPSIAYTKGNIGYNYIGVVWQQKDGSYYKIMGKMFNQSSSSSSTPSSVSTIRTLHTEPADLYSSVNANPNLVLASGNFGAYFVTFERKSTSGGYLPGINWVVGKIEDIGQAYAGPFGYVEDNGLVAGTNASTINTQMSQFPGENDIAVSLIRQQSSPGKIYSHFISLIKSGSTWIYNQVDDGLISYNANVNSSPSIVSLGNGNYSACWIEYNDMVFLYYDNINNVKYYYGDYVKSCSINRGGGNSSSGFAAWSQNPSSNWSNKSIRFYGGSPVSGSLTTLSTSGNYVQLGNCPNTSGNSNMYVSSFYPFSSPYYFQTTSSPLSKASTNLVSGRGFEINGDETAFSYRFEGLNVDGENIEFVDAPDTEDYSNLEILNKALVTEPFKISSNSKVVFTEKVGFADSLAAVKMLGKEGYINYKVELVEESTGKVIGTLRNNKLSSKNAPSLTESSYAIDTDGFGNSEVRLQIVLETNMITVSKERSSALEEFLQNEKIPGSIRNARKNKKQSNIVLVKSYSEENEALAKSSLNQITVKDLDVIDSYSLEPNYPNPFNPTTTIRYQIPNASHVVLKVYDMLGKEVATLVNKNQTTGRYEVNFDASRLASGTYIYRIEAGSYTKAYKMILLK